MSAVFEKLRAAREERGMSLEDISAATCIQVKILKALEAGEIHELPQTYVRAFLRSYAKEVGVDGTEILRLYDESRTISVPQQGAPQDRRVVDPPPPPRKLTGLLGISQSNIPFLLAGLLLLSLVISLSLFNTENRSDRVKEIPFQEVIKQRAKTSSGRVPASADSTLSSSGRIGKGGDDVPPIPLVQQSPATSAQRPPLILRAMTFDSVWIRVVIDGKIYKEYVAPPRWSAQWKAAESFVISLGNAGAVSFILDNAPLGMLGSPGKPVRNFTIDRSSVTSQTAQ